MTDYKELGDLANKRFPVVHKALAKAEKEVNVHIEQNKLQCLIDADVLVSGMK